jgi:hypothetical protein
VDDALAGAYRLRLFDSLVNKWVRSKKCHVRER